MMIGLFGPLAVVPIFVNVGAALLPAIGALIVSTVALLLKPRELFRLCRQKPVIIVVILGIIVVVLAVPAWLNQRKVGHLAVTASRVTTSEQPTDWAAVALAILRRDNTAFVPSVDQYVGALNGPLTGGMPAPGAPGQPARIPPTANASSSPVPAFSFQEDLSRCGYDGGKAPLGLQPRWQFQTDDMMFLSSPTIAANRLYAATCLMDIIGDYGKIVCLNTATGNAIWQVDSMQGQYLKGIFSSPALTADHRYLIIGQGLHADADCSLICLDAATGRLHWTVATPLHIESSPAIQGDLCVVGVGAIEKAGQLASVNKGYVLAVRISDGHELWRYPLTDPESSPAITPDGTVYIGSGIAGNAIVALRSESDAELQRNKLSRVLWRTATPYPALGHVALAGNIMLMGIGNGDYVNPGNPSAGAVIALNRQTGQVCWKTELKDAVLGAVAVRDNVVICPVRDGTVAALNLTDGSIRWRRQISGNQPVLAATAFTGKYVYAISRDGCLAILKASDGTVLETHLINDTAKPGAYGLATSAPILADGALYVGSETGGLRCFRGLKAE